jgi:hypothetical protein
MTWRRRSDTLPGPRWSTGPWWASLDASRRQIQWKGLPFCQSLVADYPHVVVDYYLHGGQQRIRDAVTDVAQILLRDLALPVTEASDAAGERAAALLEPADVHEHLVRLDRVLDTDPHYAYGHSPEPLRPPAVTGSGPRG